MLEKQPHSKFYFTVLAEYMQIYVLLVVLFQYC